MKKQNKTVWVIVGAVVLIVLIIFFKSNGKNETVITISNDGFFTDEECVIRDLNDKVIMFGSKYCGHCQATMPDFLAACETKGVEPIVLDLAESEDREQMESYGLSISYTPTFVFGCNYYAGAETSAEYLSYLEEFLKK